MRQNETFFSKNLVGSEIVRTFALAFEKSLLISNERKSSLKDFT